MREADRCLDGSGDHQRFLELYYSIIIIKRQQQTRSEYFSIRKTDFHLPTEIRNVLFVRLIYSRRTMSFFTHARTRKYAMHALLGAAISG